MASTKIYKAAKLFSTLIIIITEKKIIKDHVTLKIGVMMQKIQL